MRAGSNSSSALSSRVLGNSMFGVWRASCLVALFLVAVSPFRSYGTVDPCEADPCDVQCDPCGLGCPPHPCCEEPVTDACCGSIALCGDEWSQAVEVPAGESACQELQAFPISLRHPLGPPELPPRTLDPVAGSLPLVSAPARQAGSPIPFLTRPTQDGLIDLIFGRPLEQAIDLELPFGSAVFRHVRTHGTEEYDGSTVGHGSAFWDWNGYHWMMGENPIFLIDAQMELLHSHSMDPPVAMPQRRCYMIPDAHHAIPFLLQEVEPGNWEYVAPAWFDAVLSHDGTFLSNGEWSTRPTWFAVRLQRQSMKYTFAAIYEDWLEGDHEPPPVGRGAPHYGIVSTIEDRYGNRMEMDYCGN